MIEVWYVRPEQCGPGRLRDYSEPGWYFSTNDPDIVMGPCGSEAAARAWAQEMLNKRERK